MTTHVRWGSATHQGRVRDHNEDAVLAGPQVFAVADGMGGYAGGEVASALTVATLASAVDGRPSAGAIRDALAASNRAIVARGRAQGTPNMGSTVAGIAPAAPGTVIVFSLGDSRVYRRRGGVFEQLTEDDSVVAELVRSGEISAEQARQHPDRNVITRALGVADAIEPHVFELDTEADDVFVVASDGLFNEVDDPTMASILDEPGSEDHRARRLIDAALAGGGRDNISVILVTVTGTEHDGDLTVDTSEVPVGTSVEDWPTAPMEATDAPEEHHEHAEGLITSVPAANANATPPARATMIDVIDRVPTDAVPDDHDG